MSEQMSFHIADGLENTDGIMSASYLERNPVLLVSATMPGCGATTLVNRIGESIRRLGLPNPEVIQVGQQIRERLGVVNEDQLADRLGEVGDPNIVDRAIYCGLPDDRICIVDGKLATTTAPLHLPNGRPFVAIDLKSDLLTSAKRVLERESGVTTERLLTTEASMLVSRLALLSARADHDNSMRGQVKSEAEGPKPDFPISINTNSMSMDEILEYFSGDPKSTHFEDYVPDWEIEAVRNTLASLAYLKVMFDKNTRANDRAHFDFQYQSVLYNLDRLETTLHPAGLKDIRNALRKALVDCWMGLMMKEVPRFFEDKDGNISLDTISHAWSPEYYKIAEAWPILSTILKKKSVLDPFGGAGTMINLLAARGIISSAIVTDLSYRGGEPIDDDGHTYAAELNAQMSHVLFDGLPSWYKPNMDIVVDRFSANAQSLPIPNNSVDYIVTDPPYSKNHDSGGIGLLIGCLPEFQRVTRKGSIIMAPLKSPAAGVDWPAQISNAGFPVEKLSKDISRGQSGFPMCYIKVGHRKK